ncbi:MAG TPA: ABC transporter permease, partial [Vicinamibacterales bacterium]
EHLERAAERFRARGMSERDALLSARREFGNVGVMQEEARDARGARWIESVVGDLRHALRQFARTPLLSATIVVTLTLGIGVSAGAFAVLSGVFARPAPGVPADPSLVAVRGIQIADGRHYARGLSYAEVMDYARLPAFDEVAGWTTSMVVIETPGHAAGTANAHFVTPNYFRTLGLQIREGNDFVQRRVDEHGEPELDAIIGRLYAAEQFGTPEAAVGRTIRINGLTVKIIGLAPPRFLGPFGDGGFRALWIPVSSWPTIDRQSTNVFTARGEGEFGAIARLRDGVGAREANPAVELVASRTNQVSATATGRQRAHTADVVPLRGYARVKVDASEDLAVGAMITALALLVLLLCTTTVSSLLVGASMTRRHEIAVRLALGASRARIVRQLLTENLLLAVAAGAAGLTAYTFIAHGLRDSITDANLDPGWATALATAAFALATTVLCGLSPALHATRDAVSGVLKDSLTNATVRSRLQRVFVVAQIALTQPLLLGLAAMIAILGREGAHTPAEKLGEHVVLAHFDIWSSANRGDQMPSITRRLAALPGVIAVLPQISGVRNFKLEAPARGEVAARQFKIRTQQVANGYFKAMDIPLMRGRDFISADTALKVARIIIGSDLAAQAFGETDPIGKRMAMLTSREGRRYGEAEVIGVVAESEVGGSEFGGGIRIFTPNFGPLTVPEERPDALLIRVQGLAEPMISTFQEIARAEAPMMPARDMKTLAQIERDARSEIIQATSASAVAGIVTLFLAAIGLYAVIALGVSQRRREIGVRISLGARPGQVVAMFFRSGLRVSVIGLLIGLPLSAATLMIVGSEIGMPRMNLPLLALSVAGAVVTVACLASWIPARRAAGVDPLEVLKS